ncbi:hypothetical protein Hanom_Chr06g00571811 [Helianthus anomalus]
MLKEREPRTVVVRTRETREYTEVQHREASKSKRGGVGKQCINMKQHKNHA